MKTKKQQQNNDLQEIVPKRAIIICWGILLVCFVVKIFGGNFFNIVCNDTTFISICAYIDTSWIIYLLQYFVFIIETIILLNITAICSKRRLSVFLLIATAYWFIKVFLIPLIPVRIVYEAVILIGMFLMLYLYSNKFWRSILVVVLGNAFLIISMFVKGLSLIEPTFNTSSLTFYIFAIDYYIMLLLTMFYFKKKNIIERRDI